MNSSLTQAQLGQTEMQARLSVISTSSTGLVPRRLDPNSPLFKSSSDLSAI